jgi:hypothetical protein
MAADRDDKIILSDDNEIMQLCQESKWKFSKTLIYLNESIQSFIEISF